MKRFTACNRMNINAVTTVAQMSIICLHTCSKMLTSLFNCTVIDAVVHGVRNVQKVLLQFVISMYPRLTISLLDDAPYLVVDKTKVGAF